MALPDPLHIMLRGDKKMTRAEHYSLLLSLFYTINAPNGKLQFLDTFSASIYRAGKTLIRFERSLSEPRLCLALSLVGSFFSKTVYGTCAICREVIWFVQTCINRSLERFFDLAVCLEYKKMPSIKI